MAAATAPRMQPLPPPIRRAVATMYAGMALTVLATVLVPLVVALGTDQYADYIQHAYPTYTTAEVDHCQRIILIYLGVNGVLGVLAWLWAMRQTKKRSSFVHIATAVLFGCLGLSSALINAFTKDSTGYPALSSLLGIVGFLPSVAGLVVVLLWRARTADRTGRP